MTTIGIAAEFDPFHRGHAHLIAQIRRRYEPGSTIVAAMSGDFTQRGNCASFDRHLRGELALLGGVDLVLELPLPWAISSAERFALGSVRVLAASGAKVLAFGSESGDLDRLRQAAAALDHPDYPARLRETLGTGISFAAARQRVVAVLAGEEVAAVLGTPNDLLGVSYLSALRRLGLSWEVCAIPRIGPGHNAAGEESGFRSASEVRRLLRWGETEGALAALPELCRPVVRRALEEGKGPASLSYNERAVLTRLKELKPEDFCALPDCSEGLEHRLFRAAQAARRLEEFYAWAKTKRYAHARLRRLVLWAYLGLTWEERPTELPYLRPLAMNGKGRELLHRQKKDAPVPLLTKPAAVRRLGQDAQRLFSLEVRANDLWRMCLPTLEHSAWGEEWKRGVLVSSSKNSCIPSQNGL